MSALMVRHIETKKQLTKKQPPRPQQADSCFLDRIFTVRLFITLLLLLEEESGFFKEATGSPMASWFESIKQGRCTQRSKNPAQRHTPDRCLVDATKTPPAGPK
jgi:hypothetical protein